MNKIKLSEKFTRRFIVMLFAHVLFGFANALLRLSGQGNDPASAMVFALSGKTGLSLTVWMWSTNLLFFLVQFATDRTLVGPGTFINWLCVGPFTEICLGLYNRMFTLPDVLSWKLCAAAFSILLFSLAASMYQTADLGISPYDSLSIALSRKLKKPFFACRIFTDCVCSVVTVVLGGVLGVGTLICAVGLGPIIAFLNRHVSQKLCDYKPQ